MCSVDNSPSRIQLPAMTCRACSDSWGRALIRRIGEPIMVPGEPGGACACGVVAALLDLDWAADYASPFRHAGTLLNTLCDG